MRIREELDFDSGLITSYGYEAYRENERLYWYDDFPHPHDPSLAIKLIKENQYQITGDDSGNKWYGIGFFDGEMYYGVWYTGQKIGDKFVEYLHGTHEAHLNPDSSFKVIMRDPRKPGDKEVRVSYQDWKKSK